MHDHAPGSVIADALRQTQHTFCRIGIYRLRCLRLDECLFLRPWRDDEINLQSALVPEEVEFAAAP